MLSGALVTSEVGAGGGEQRGGAARLIARGAASRIRRRAAAEEARAPAAARSRARNIGARAGSFRCVATASECAAMSVTTSGDQRRPASDQPASRRCASATEKPQAASRRARGRAAIRGEHGDANTAKTKYFTGKRKYISGGTSLRSSG